MLQKIYPYRFPIFLSAQIAVLFGSLVFHEDLFNNYISPILNFLALFAGLILLSKKGKIIWLSALIFLGLVSFFIEVFDENQKYLFNLIRLVIFFIFHIIVTKELIFQIWNTKKIDENTIMGLISGFISLGFLGFIISLITELIYPNSFIIADNNTISIFDNLLYFSYVTLLTIGYGDILPATALAQKIVVLIGLVGQMYLVVLTSIVIGKYISQKSS
ncbi:MAG: potassium channel family protein [Flavobacteriales bacterium]|jgi:voltage-gated potassium channel Kch|nr:potassium channel family protein [Flavobacteriales bacterium]